MIELPEATVLANQLQKTVGKKITDLILNQNPHKLVWFYDQGAHYEDILKNQTITAVMSYGGQVVIVVPKGKLVLGDGINIRYQPQTPPLRHQLALELDHKEHLYFFASMYGGIVCFSNQDPEYLYYQIAKEKPSPLSESFNLKYWNTLFEIKENLSLKAFLATNQRIPGIGNGVIQDILWRAKLHPKQKIDELTERDKTILFQTLKGTLQEMINQKGRASEKDIYGEAGYFKLFSSFASCPVCSNPIIKEAYLGGSIYYRPSCQKESKRKKS